MKVRLLLSVLAIALTFASCSKDNDNSPQLPPNVKKVTNLDVNNKWVTFSFETGVATATTATPTTTSLDWDIAFNSFLVKLNGGESGSGQAAALNTHSQDFFSISKAPVEGYSADNVMQVLIGYPNTQTVTCSLSKPMIGGFGVTEGIIHIAPENMGADKYPSVYRPTKWVYILKRANGKFVKFQLTDCYNDKAKAVYLTFQYQLSEDSNF